MSKRLNVLHIANLTAGPAAMSVSALKQWSKHRHELVARTANGLEYSTPSITEYTATPDFVRSMVEQADVLHFHGVGFNGSLGDRQTIHGIDFAEYRGAKKFIFHGYLSMLRPDGSWALPGGDRYAVSDLPEYDMLAGSHPSCEQAYAMPQMRTLPDILPIFDWLLSPVKHGKPRRACSYYGRKHQRALTATGVDLEVLQFGSVAPILLDYVRHAFSAALDNYSDGHWSTFGIVALALGLPCLAFVHPVNWSFFDTIKADRAPFVETEYGGATVADSLKRILSLPDEELQAIAGYGRAWIERFYDPERLTWVWDDAYDSLN